MNRTLGFIGLAIVAVGFCAGGSAVTVPDSIPIRDAFVRVLEKAEVPARDPGSLSAVLARRGDSVDAGQELARLDDAESHIGVKLAELEHSIARRQAENTLPVDIADAKVREAGLDKKRAEIGQNVAKSKADSDVGVAEATKRRDAALREYTRAKSARDRYAPSMPLAELEKLELAWQLAELDLKQAQLDEKVATFQVDIEQTTLDQFSAAFERLRHEAAQVRNKQAIATLTQEVRSQSLSLSRILLKKRSIRSPIKGVVADVLKQNGEWVEPGTIVARVIRLDKLMVEGYINADSARQDLRGRSVRIVLPGSGAGAVFGKVTFVSSEVDSVNNQVLIHVEFENKNRAARPGEEVTASVDLSGR